MRIKFLDLCIFVILLLGSFSFIYMDKLATLSLFTDLILLLSIKEYDKSKIKEKTIGIVIIIGLLSGIINYIYLMKLNIII